MNNSSTSVTTILPPTAPVLQGTTDSVVEATFTCLLIMTTLAANTFVCVTILRKSFHPKRLANYFIINLCISDILVAVVSMPVWVIFKLYGETAPFLLGTPFLTSWRNVDILCGTASILSLASISLDRYLAVTKPMRYIEYMTSSRAKVLIGVIWAYSTIVAFLREPFVHIKGGYALFVLFVSFLLPSALIAAVYHRMFKVALRHLKDISKSRSLKDQENYKRVSRDLKAAKTIAVVIGTFVCCWLPFIVVSVCFAFTNVNLTVANFTKWLAYINALLNPVVYSSLDKQLRNMTAKKFGCQKN